MNAKVLAFVFLLVLLLFVIELVRSGRLTFKYAFGWILLFFAGILLVIFDQLVAGLAAFFGFALPSNFIFFSCVVGGIFMALFLTIFLCQQNIRNDKIAQKIALLEVELQRLSGKQV